MEKKQATFWKNKNKSEKKQTTILIKQKTNP